MQDIQPCDGAHNRGSYRSGMYPRYTGSSRPSCKTKWQARPKACLRKTRPKGPEEVTQTQKFDMSYRRRRIVKWSPRGMQGCRRWEALSSRFPVSLFAFLLGRCLETCLKLLYRNGIGQEGSAEPWQGGGSYLYHHRHLHSTVCDGLDMTCDIYHHLISPYP